jgi:hypothetical protein
VTGTSPVQSAEVPVARKTNQRVRVLEKNMDNLIIRQLTVKRSGRPVTEKTAQHRKDVSPKRTSEFQGRSKMEICPGGLGQMARSTEGGTIMINPITSPDLQPQQKDPRFKDETLHLN